MIRLYGIPNCNKIRNTQKLFQKHEINFDFINVRKTPLTEDKLRHVISELGIEAVLNKKGTTYRRLQLDYDKMSDDERFGHLLRAQSMINRPLIEKRDHYHVGFDEEAILRFVNR
jgi:Spx/MgsR family transcriptional regulator